MLRSQDNQVFVIFNNPMIYQICKHHDARQGAFLNMYFEPRLNKSSNMAN